MSSEPAIAGRTAFLTRYFDPNLEIPKKTTTKDLEAAQVARLSRSLVVVEHTGEVARRLEEATAEDQAIDRKRAKRVAHAIRQSLAGWQKNAKLPSGEALRLEGAQLVWDSWMQAYLVSLNNEAKRIATWAILNEEQKWGRSAIVKIDNEMNWISYAMRD